MTSYHDKALAFARLHHAEQPLLLPNPWDAGSARLLANMGFRALATTSLGVAIGQGRRRASREGVLANCREICDATALPVTADLENGFADDPAVAAECVAAARDCGAVGASIEDSTGDRRRPLYDFGHAVERVAAAVQSAHGGGSSMVLTARAEGLLFDPAGLDEVIQRLQAFESAGADVLYAPYVKDLDTMKTIVRAVNKPVNVVMGFADPTITLDDLRVAGVRRISIGGGLCRVAVRAFLDAGRQMRDGRFDFVRDMAGIDELFDAFPAAEPVG